MLFIGITGGIASGKTTVSKLLAKEHGLPVIAADDISHKATKKPEAIELIKQAFGSEIIKGGFVNRKALGEIVFKDEEARLALEKILHPIIYSEVEILKAGIEEQGKPVLFYDCPLLFEKGLENTVDKILLVYCSQATQIERLGDYRGLNSEDALLRIAAQDPIDSKLDKSDYILYNDSDMQDLEESVTFFLELLRSETGLEIISAAQVDPGK